MVGQNASFFFFFQQLKTALDAFAPSKWKLNPEDGAFYGPKVDFQLTDELGRTHQCATIQLDFQLPIRFNLQFQAADGSLKRPVMIHRAILGSLERMIALLTEQYAGKWPFWLSPRQVMVIPGGVANYAYGKEIMIRLKAKNFYCDVDLSDATFAKKIRTAQVEQYNFLLVVGDQEQKENTINVRTRDGVVHGTRKLEEIIQDFQKLLETKK